LYLVGDIVDGYLLKKRWFWDGDCNVFLQKVLRLARKNVNITYCIGNHDSFMEYFAGHNIDKIKIVRETIHYNPKYGNLLVTHGDCFDGFVRMSPLLQKIGAYSYELLMHFNYVFRLFGLKWSFSQFCKKHVKDAIKYINNYKQIVIDRMMTEGVSGCICGHIHCPELSIDEATKTVYANCGDWVESSTLLVEHFDGNLEIITIK
jgi:UDP-2,3-diacylglucosamine pyrophosphatase LpxH